MLWRLAEFVCLARGIHRDCLPALLAEPESARYVLCPEQDFVLFVKERR
jgi:hypothetical protein